MKVAGLDLSLTGTGVAGPTATYTLSFPALRGVERLIKIRDEVVRARRGADLVGMEGYSMGTARQQSHAHALGELGGVVRVALHESGVPFIDPAPAVLKRYATGKGNANKGMVLEAASKRSGLDFGGDFNRADAAWLRWLGLDAYGEPAFPMPESHRVALRSVRWPVLAPTPTEALG